MDFSTKKFTKEKEGRCIGDCRSRGRGGLYLGGWSTKRKRTMHVATHGYPNATVTDGEVCHGGECFTEDELIAAEGLLGLHEGPVSSMVIAAETLLGLQSELCTSTAAAADDEEIIRRPKERVKKSLSPLLDPILPVDFKAQIRELTGGSQEEEAKFMAEKEGQCRGSGRGGLYLGGWSKKKKRTIRVATHGYPNATVTDEGVYHRGESITKVKFIAAETLLGLQSELCTSTEAAADDEEIICRPKKRVKKSSFPLLDPILPVAFKARIRELTGRSQDAKFVYEKKLYKSDTTRGENRLLIPLKQIKNEFLSEEEKQELGRRLSGGKECQKIEVELIQPSLEVCTINLKKWDMGGKSTGKLSENYVLVTTWHEVVKENQLNIGTTVQLWSFRKHGDLCFALVKKGQ